MAINFYICNDEPDYDDLITHEFEFCSHFFILNKKLSETNIVPDCIVDFNNNIRYINEETLNFFKDSKFKDNLFFTIKKKYINILFPANSLLIKTGCLKSVFYIYSSLPYNVNAIDSKQYVYKCIYNSLMEIENHNKKSDHIIKNIIINTINSKYIKKIEFIKMFKLAYCHYIYNKNTNPDKKTIREQKYELQRLLNTFDD